MYKLKVVVLFLILNYSSFSQTTLKGWVKDSLQTSLSYANVIAKPKDSVHDLVFSITDKLGNYQLLLKKGKYTPGTNIEINLSKYISRKNIDYMLLLSWNLRSEILKQETKFLRQGGKFIIPFPKPKIIKL